MSNVTHPQHYNSGKIEVIEAIEDWKMDYPCGNAIKYVARAGKKDPTKEIEDLQKAVWYLKRKIEKLTAEKEGREPLRPNAMNTKIGGFTSVTAVSPSNPLGKPQDTAPDVQFKYIGLWKKVFVEEDLKGPYPATIALAFIVVGNQPPEEFNNKWFDVEGRSP